MTRILRPSLLGQRRSHGLLGLLTAVLLVSCTSPSMPWVRVPALEGPLPTAARQDLDDAADRNAWVFLGEGDHYIEEKYAYRLGFLRPLVVDHGYRSLALEMGGSDAGRIDRFLETGDESWLDRVVLYGYRGESALERRELSPFPPLPPNSCGVHFADAEKRFWRQVRQLSLEAVAIDGRRIHLFGFDFDTSPGGGYQDARVELAGCLAHPGLTSLAERLTPATGGSTEITRLRSLSVELLESTVVDACGLETATSAADILSRLASSYETAIAWSMAGDQPTDALRRMFEQREELMFDQIRRIQDGRPGVLLAHNMHVARNSESLRFGPAGHSLPMWQSIGTHLDNSLDQTPYIVWFLYAEGGRLQPTETGCESEVSLRDPSLEAAMSELMGDHLGYLRSREAPPGSMLLEDQEFGTATSFGGGVVADAADAFVFSPTAQPSIQMPD